MSETYFITNKDLSEEICLSPSNLIRQAKSLKINMRRRLLRGKRQYVYSFEDYLRILSYHNYDKHGFKKSSELPKAIVHFSDDGFLIIQSKINFKKI